MSDIDGVAAPERNPPKRVRPLDWLAGSWIRPERRHAIYLRDALCCVYCGESIANTAVATLDHIWPRGHAASSHHEEVVVSCCNVCNSRKGDMDVLEYLEKLSLDGEDTGPILRRLSQRHDPIDREAGKVRLRDLRR